MTSHKGKRLKNSKSEVLKELKPPVSVANYSNSDILLGKPRPAIDQLKLFSDTEYEEFTNEWLYGCRRKDYYL